MTVVGRSLIRAASCGLTLASVALPHVAGAGTMRFLAPRAGTVGTASACISNPDVYGQHCYFPTQIRHAESSIAFRPVDPSGSVGDVSGLRLYRIFTTLIAGPHQSIIPGGQITYVYGTLPPHLVAPHLFAPTTPRFVIVTETLGHGNYPDQITMSEGYVKKWHASSPWHFVVVGPLPGIALEVESNLREQQVRAIGRRIVAVSRLRKPRPWLITRVLTVQGVESLCSQHQLARFRASVRGYLVGIGLHGPGGGWVGRLFYKPNPRAFHSGDATPFVQVWGNRAWTLTQSNQWITFHGILWCDAARYADLPGWRGSIIPDRFSSG